MELDLIQAITQHDQQHSLKRYYMRLWLIGAKLVSLDFPFNETEEEMLPPLEPEEPATSLAEPSPVDALGRVNLGPNVV
jgi:hypothetical protein